MRKLVFSLLIVAVFPCLITRAQDEIPSQLVDATVLVDTDRGVGTGIIFKNKSTSFVWTCGHVVRGCQTTKTVIDPDTGLPKVSVAYSDVVVVTEITQDGRKIGDNFRLAKILRYSMSPDVALLLVYEKNYGSASVEFSDTIPKKGEAVWHVGCFKGAPGFSSVSDGRVAAIGRLRKDGLRNELDNPDIFDQVSMVAHQGSSGGGVFSKSTNKCIGIISQFLALDRAGLSDGALCITPSREIITFAKRAKVEFAVDKTKAVPTLDVIMATPVTFDEIPLPADWPKAAE